MIFNQNINLLLIEDEEYDVRRIKKTLEPFRERIRIKKVVADGRSAIDVVQKYQTQFDVVIMDYQIVGGITGETLIRRIKELDATIQIIVITKMTVNITDFEFANRLLEAGAMWYCTKYPGDIEDFIYQPTDFVLSIMNAFEKRRLEKDRKRSKQKLKQSVQEILDSRVLIGNSEPVLKLNKQIEQAANQDATVLISGPSGTGKELVATHIHYRSKRRFEKIMSINSGSLPQELIESELFGFEKGSFTGANAKKAGLFEIANRGTIFLDEIGELPHSAQVKLLRVLQEGEIDKIGRIEKSKVDVRVIAATNKNLIEAIEEKKFREDLFYRLNVFNITLPSLRERRSDIPLLLDHFLEKFGRQMSITVPKVTEEAIEYLSKFDWPGNVRQLQNVVHRLLFIEDENITISDVKDALGPQKQKMTASPYRWDENNIIPWRDMEKTIKHNYFQFVRNNTDSDADAARKLGLAPPNFYRMCKELGLK